MHMWFVWLNLLMDDCHFKMWFVQKCHSKSIVTPSNWAHSFLCLCPTTKNIHPGGFPKSPLHLFWGINLRVKQGLERKLGTKHRGNLQIILLCIHYSEITADPNSHDLLKLGYKKEFTKREE